MKHLVFLPAIILLVIFTLSCGVVQGGTVMKAESAAEQLFFVTVRIETERANKTGSPITSVGTGFIVSHKWDNKEGLFLVTNKHVVKGAQKARFFFMRSDGKNPILGKTYNIEMDNFNKAWFGHPDDKIDVAVIPLSGILSEAQKRKWSIFYRSISKDLLPTAQQEKDLDAIEEIVFVGYPSGIYDTVNYLPVVRTGTTATSLNVNYAGLPQFLIDASVFPGSSGSPVFILNRGSYSPKSGGLVAGNRIIFLGLVSEVYLRNEEGVWKFVDIPTRIVPIVKTQQMIDLGIVVKATTVFEAIDALLKLKGEIQ